MDIEELEKLLEWLKHHPIPNPGDPEDLSILIERKFITIDQAARLVIRQHQYQAAQMQSQVNLLNQKIAIHNEISGFVQKTAGVKVPELGMNRG
jgi:hypothetical protein